MFNAFEQVLLGVFGGVLLGLISGLVPGMHINLLGSTLLSASIFLPSYSMLISSLIFSAAASQLFSSFIPSIFLGAPSSENFLSALPGHKLLLKGFGMRALFISVVAALLGMLCSFLLLPVFIFLAPHLYRIILPAIPYSLIIVSLSMFLKEETLKKRVWAVVCFLLSGAAGIVALNSQMRNPLTPMLSGLFGAGMLMFSIFSTSRIPNQHSENFRISASSLKNLPFSVLSGGLVCLFPAMGPAQAAAISSELSKAEGEDYLVLSGGISSANLLLSLGTALSIGKARNGGTALAVSFGISERVVAVLALCALVSAALSAFIVMLISPLFLSLIQKFNYGLIAAFSLASIFLICFISSGFVGVVLFLVCSSIGLLANLLGLNRSCLMGCLTIPIIFNYFT
ncbi:MAG: tripartite tricarboxylate transporter permease [Candidatus Woesearchaeota archaeon]